MTELYYAAEIILFLLEVFTFGFIVGIWFANKEVDE